MDSTRTTENKTFKPSKFAVFPNYNGEGVRYEGEVLEEGGFQRAHGKGLLRFRDGSIYEGDFVDGLKHGRGVYWWATGHRFEGEWVHNQRHRGTYTWPDGAWYEGTFRDSESHTEPGDTGRRVDLTAGLVQKGSWNQGWLQGWASLRWEAGHLFCELDARSRRQGRCTTFCWNGCVLEATYVDDSRVGPASFLWPNGDRWEGRFDQHDVATGRKTSACRKPLEGEFVLVFSGSDTEFRLVREKSLGPRDERAEDQAAATRLDSTTMEPRSSHCE